MRPWTIGRAGDLQPARVSIVGSNSKRCRSGKGRGTRDFLPDGFGYQYVAIEKTEEIEVPDCREPSHLL